MPTDREHITLAQMEQMRMGARTAVQTCMGVTAPDRVVVLTDQSTHGIGHLLAEEASETQAQAVVLDLEQFGARPLRVLPEALRSLLLEFQPTVTFFAATAPAEEGTFRSGLRVFLQRDLGVRHAHMPGISSRLMVEGMRADYRAVASLTRAVYDIARLASAMHVTTHDGSDLTAWFDPALRWVPSTGVYRRPGAWGSLPGGTTFSCPSSVEGELAVHVIGAHFAPLAGVLPQPLHVEVREGRLTAIRHSSPALEGEFRAFLEAAQNGSRVGKFAIGTNCALHTLTGNMLQDEKAPGAHIAFGSPFPSETGATWSSAIHVELVPRDCTITIDGETIMRDGQFDYDALGVPAPR